MNRPIVVARHLGFLLLLVNCGTTETNDRCLFTDTARITAPSELITLDDSVTLQASLVMSDCLPGGLEPVEWRWSTSDTTVVRIDSLTGVAVGVGLGTATALVQHARSPGVQSTIDLRVVATAADSRSPASERRNPAPNRTRTTWKTAPS